MTQVGAEISHFNRFVLKTMAVFFCAFYVLFSFGACFGKSRRICGTTSSSRLKRRSNSTTMQPRTSWKKVKSLSKWFKNQKQWICLVGKLMMGPMLLAILYFAPCNKKRGSAYPSKKILFEKDSFLQTFDFLELHSSNSLDVFLLVH